MNMENKQKELEFRIAKLEAENFELKKARNLLDSHIGLTWISMIGTAWRHSINNLAVTIREQTKLIRLHHEQNKAFAGIDRQLDNVEILATEIMQQSFTPLLSSDDEEVVINLNNLLRKRLKQLQEYRQSSDITITLDLDSTEEAYVRASPEWIRRAIDILVDNSIAAMSKSSEKSMTFTSSIKNKQLEISVKDTGCGISPEISSALFTEPVHKKGESTGSGVGLLIARMILLAYNGDLRLTHTDKTGTTFTIIIPVAS
jgi:signal transduction histidine kinase